jgi:hypothetical protein
LTFDVVIVVFLDAIVSLGKPSYTHVVWALPQQQNQKCFEVTREQS